MTHKTTYIYKAHPTTYAGVRFRSRLEARWAAFFDVVGWKWEYEPIDLPGWSPDFRVEFKCGHSKCSGSHVLLVEVKPYHSIEEFDGHPCMDYFFGENENGDCIPANASAAFGIDPSVSYWEMSHGSGGGTEHVGGWVLPAIGVPWWDRVPRAWKEAGNKTQWNPRR